MPQKQEYRTKINQRVVIRDAATHMYPMARAYNEGWVRRQQHDHLGYPLIYVEWDKDHWAYSGEEDRWVLEAHFDPVEDSMAEDKYNNLLKALADLVANIQAEPGDEPEDQTGPDELEEKDKELTYEYVLQRGAEAALAGSAYLLFVAHKEELNGHEVTIPILFMHSKDDEGALMVESAAADHVAHTAQRMIQDLLREQADGSPESS
jgi:hypothetical protein